MQQEEELAGLTAMIERAGGLSGAIPPVERWNPPESGHLDMRIDRDGTWFYRGSPIRRPALVRLFASVLRRETDGRICLVTPVEKYEIEVEDAPFLAVEMQATRREHGPVLTFRTNVGDIVEAGPDHPLRFATEKQTGGFKPYLSVRHGLEALASRPVALEMADHGEEIDLDGQQVFALRSAGAIFPIAPASKLAGIATENEARS